MPKRNSYKFSDDCMTEQNAINNTVDIFFKNRCLPYRRGTNIGDTVIVHPNTFVPNADAALGVTPIYVILDHWVQHKVYVPEKAFWMELLNGGCLFGETWKSGETSYG